MRKKWAELPRCFDLLFDIKWEHELVREINRLREIESLMKKTKLKVVGERVVSE